MAPGTWPVNYARNAANLQHFRGEKSTLNAAACDRRENAPQAFTLWMY
jgi:hypothetical protein